MTDKVLHLINSSGQGGAETVVKNIIKNMNHDVFCLKKDKVETFGKVSNKIYFGTFSKFYKFNPLIFFKLQKVIKKKSIKVLHVHLAASLLYGVLIKFLFPRLKVIYNEHGEIYRNSKLRILLKYFNKNIDLIIAVSKATKSELMKKANIPENKIRVLYNFVDLDKFNRKKIKWNIQKERDKLGINKEEFVIGFVGRLAEVKGCKYLIKALPYLNFKYKVLIAGDGPQRKELKNLAKSLGVKEKVIFLGYVEDIMKIYSLLDLYIMPSKSEASPMVFYEVQALGIPIIGSEVPAINEFIIPNKNGLLFKCGDSKKLSKNLNFLFNNIRVRKEMSRYSIENIQKFDLNNYLSQLNAVYVDLLK